MKALLNVKELASALGVSVKSVQRAYRKQEIPVQCLCRMALFDLDDVRRAMTRNGKRRFDTSEVKADKERGAAGGASRRRTGSNSPRTVKRGRNFQKDPRRHS
ncbi:protein of unknown function [Nitrospira japonica]|uniref:Helix-turn-helix domain-containing protein n=1 Tax=Nitrospira japonica TaxID=1325564 RepID=A0A1W1I4V9_9BACT|nr:DNA-binding protein [Nitrospira japonica]SLM48044.1 protein of unknown function [Nitrospira japonica]